VLILSLIVLTGCAAVGSAWYVHIARRPGGSPVAAWVILRGVISAPIRLWSNPPGRHRVQGNAVAEVQLSSNQTVLPGDVPS
jgi:hypothetical protein